MHGNEVLIEDAAERTRGCLAHVAAAQSTGSHTDCCRGRAQSSDDHGATPNVRRGTVTGKSTVRHDPAGTMTNQNRR